MELILEKPSFAEIAADVLVIGIFQDEQAPDLIKQIDSQFPQDFLAEIGELCKTENFKGKSKESLSVFTAKKIAARRLILLGLGKKADFNAAAIRKAAATLAKQFAPKQAYPYPALFLRFDGKAENIQACVEGWVLGCYSFNVYKTQKDNGNEPGDKTRRLTFLDSTLDEKSFEDACASGRAIAEASCFARDMINE